MTVLGAGAASAGKLTVTGTATILGGADAVSVHVPTTVNAFALLGDSWHVLTSGALSANASALTASSDNPGIGFGLTDSSTDLVLSTLAQTPNQILAAAAEDVNTILAEFPGLPNSNQAQARLFLQYVFAGLVEHGQTALANQLFNVLVDPLSPAQAVQFNNQLMPSTLASVQMDIATTTNVLGVGESTIAGRLTSARLGTGQPARRRRPGRRRPYLLGPAVRCAQLAGRERRLRRLGCRHLWHNTRRRYAGAA